MVFSSLKMKKKKRDDADSEMGETSSFRTDTEQQQSIYYFGIGPIVNSQVRKRQRWTCVSHSRAAVLPNHRLTFCYGGIANVVQQRGYEVHGVLMKWGDSEQWDRWLKTHPGYTPEVLEVFPYTSYESFTGPGAIKIAVYAHVFVFKDWDEQTLDSKIIENLPSERYLKLIAYGMRESNADEDFIQDSILSVPFLPSRKPEDYQTFPFKQSNKRDTLPKISLSKYQRMCQKSKTNIYFILGHGIFQLNKPFEMENPGIQWVKQHCHGRDDSTLMLHRTCVEPGLPVVDTQEELTDDHRRWAENEAVEFLKKCGVTATRLYELVDESNKVEGQRSSLFGQMFGG